MCEGQRENQTLTGFCDHQCFMAHHDFDKMYPTQEYG